MKKNKLRFRAILGHRNLARCHYYCLCKGCWYGFLCW